MSSKSSPTHPSLADRSTKVSDIQSRRIKRFRLHKQYLHNYMAEIEACVRQTDYLKKDSKEVTDLVSSKNKTIRSQSKLNNELYKKKILADHQTTKKEETKKKRIRYPHVSFDLSNPPPRQLAKERAKKELKTSSLRNVEKTCRFSSEENQESRSIDPHERTASSSSSNKLHEQQEHEQMINNKSESSSASSNSENNQQIINEESCTSSHSAEIVEEEDEELKSSSVTNETENNKRNSLSSSDSIQNDQNIEEEEKSENNVVNNENEDEDKGNNDDETMSSDSDSYRNKSKGSSSSINNENVDVEADDDESSADELNSAGKHKSHTSFFMKGNVDSSSGSDYEPNIIGSSSSASSALKNEKEKEGDHKINEVNSSDYVIDEFSHSSPNKAQPTPEKIKKHDTDDFNYTYSSSEMRNNAEADKKVIPESYHSASDSDSSDSKADHLKQDQTDQKYMALDNSDISSSSQKVNKNVEKEEKTEEEKDSAFPSLLKNKEENNNNKSDEEPHSPCKNYNISFNQEEIMNEKIPEIKKRIRRKSYCSRFNHLNFDSILDKSGNNNSNNNNSNNSNSNSNNNIETKNDESEVQKNTALSCPVPNNLYQKNPEKESHQINKANLKISTSSDSENNDAMKYSKTGNLSSTSSSNSFQSPKNCFVSFSSSSCEKPKAHSAAASSCGRHSNDDIDNGESFFSLGKKPTQMFSNYDGPSNFSFDFKPLQPVSSSESDDILPKLKKSYRLILDSSSDDDRRSSSHIGRSQNRLLGRSNGMFSYSSDSDDAV